MGKQNCLIFANDVACRGNLSSASKLGKKDVLDFIKKLCFLFSLILNLSACSLDLKIDSSSFDRLVIPVELSSSIHNPTFENEIPVVLSFGSEISEALTSDHIQITGGVLKDNLISENLAGRAYSLTVVPSGEGVVQIHFPMQKVSVPEPVGQRYAASSSLSLLVDRSAPTVQLTSSTSNPTGLGVIPVEVTFSESITDLSSTDFDVLGATAILLVGSGSVYTLSLTTPVLYSDIEVRLPSGSVKDLAGNGNAESNVFKITYDGRSPTPSLSTVAGDPTGLAKLPVTVSFDRPVTGLTASDFTVTNGNVTDFSGSGASYNFYIENSVDGVVSVMLPAGAAQGILGINNINSNTLSFNVDRKPGSLTITGPAQTGGNSSSSFAWTLTYANYHNISLDGSHIIVRGSAGVSCLVPTISSPSAGERTITLTGCTGDGTVGIEIEADSAQTVAGVSFLKDTSATSAVVDNTGPALTITGPTPAVGSSSTTFEWSVAYADAHEVTVNLSDENIGITGAGAAGCKATVSSTGNPRKVSVSGCTGDGLVGISIAAATAEDAFGNQSLSASSSGQATVDNEGPPITIGAGTPDRGNVDTVFQWDVTYSGADEIRLSEATKETYVSLLGAKVGCAFSVEDTDDVTRRIKVVGCSGDGNLGLSISADSARDALGNKSVVATSSNVVVDNTGPGISISAPSLLIGNKDKSFSWLVTYSEESTITLNTDDILLSGATANCTKSVTGSGDTQRTVVVTGCTGEGTLSFTIKEGSASDSIGNAAGQSVTSASVTLDNTAPTITINAPSPIEGYDHTQFEWTVSYSGADLIHLNNSHVTVEEEATGCVITVLGSGTETRTVRLSGCTGHSQVGISIAAGTAQDDAGNTAPMSGPSATVKLLNRILVNFNQKTSLTKKGVGDEIHEIPFTLGKALLVDVNINYRVTAHTTATNPTNYDLATTGFVTVPAGQTSGKINYQYLGASAGSKIVQLALDTKGSNGYNFESTSPLHRKLVMDVSTGDAEYIMSSAGQDHTCGIRKNGALYCWGRYYGQLGKGTTIDSEIPAAIDSGNTYISVSAGIEHTCGIRTSGALYCWGRNYSGSLGDGTTSPRFIPTLVSGGGAYTSVSAGEKHTCAIRAGGALYCWGNNSYGQLGVETAGDKNIPTVVDGSNTYVSVSAGNEYTCGIRTGGALYCWGRNDYGQLGNGTKDNIETPAAIDIGNTYIRVSAGKHHTCGIRTGGAMFCWGRNNSGQLGNATWTESLFPTAISSSDTYISVSAGQMHTCGVVTGGALYCWGENYYGELGSEIISNWLTTPGSADSSNTYVSVSAGRNYTCGIRTGGALYCWGSGSYGQLGDGAVDKKTIPMAIDSSNTYISAARGSGIRTGGALYLWGSNDEGQLGDGTKISKTTPTAIDSSNTYISVSRGTYHTCGIRTGGALYCWGRNSEGQLGDGTTGGKITPTAVDSSNTYISVSVGLYHTCGIRTGGALYCWGQGIAGQLGDGTTVNKNIPTAVSGGNTYVSVSAGNSHTCGIRTGGALYCWGGSFYGQLGDGTTVNKNIPTAVSGGNTYVSVSAGNSHTCGIRTGGALYCWGEGFYGQLGDGTAVNKNIPTAVSGGNTYVSVGAGNYHTCGIRTGGALYCWGKNDDGQLGDGTIGNKTTPTPVDSSNTYISVSAGICGIRTSGALYCWGSNYAGQLGDDSLRGVMTPVSP